MVSGGVTEEVVFICECGGAALVLFSKGFLSILCLTLQETLWVFFLQYSSLDLLTVWQLDSKKEKQKEVERQAKQEEIRKKVEENRRAIEEELNSTIERDFQNATLTKTVHLVDILSG